MNKVLLTGTVCEKPFISENFAIVKIETIEEVSGELMRNVHTVKIMKNGVKMIKENIFIHDFVEFDGKQINNRESNKEANVLIGFIKKV
jgi:hypothetical protein